MVRTQTSALWVQIHQLHIPPLKSHKTKHHPCPENQPGRVPTVKKESPVSQSFNRENSIMNLAASIVKTVRNKTGGETQGWVAAERANYPSLRRAQGEEGDGSPFQKLSGNGWHYWWRSPGERKPRKWELEIPDSPLSQLNVQSFASSRKEAPEKNSQWSALRRHV